MKSLSLNQPHAIIMVGIPGSGKTFFASKFSDTFGAPYVSLPEIAKHVANIESADSLVELLLEELLKTSASIVLELDTSTRQKRTEISRYCKAAGYQTLFVWVQTDPETAKARIERDKSKDTATTETLSGKFSPPHDNEKAVVISGKHTYASQAKIILKHLSAPRAEISAHRQPPVRSSQTIVVR